MPFKGVCSIIIEKNKYKKFYYLKGCFLTLLPFFNSNMAMECPKFSKMSKMLFCRPNALQ